MSAHAISLYLLSILFLGNVLLTPAFAARYPLDTRSDLVGDIRYEDLKGSWNASRIAQKFGLGINAIRQANPELSQMRQSKKLSLLIPDQHILPVVRDGIVVNLSEYRLYYFSSTGEVYTYPVAIGAEQSPSPITETYVVSKIEKPTWYPSSETRAHYLQTKGIELPWEVPAGPGNPLGPYAIKLSLPGYFLHGTNQQWGIGVSISSGCIRLYNRDIAELTFAVPNGTPTHFIRQPIKLGQQGSRLFVEVHTNGKQYSKRMLETAIIRELIAYEKIHGAFTINMGALDDVTSNPLGIPQAIGIYKKVNTRT